MRKILNEKRKYTEKIILWRLMLNIPNIFGNARKNLQKHQKFSENIEKRFFIQIPKKYLSGKLLGDSWQIPKIFGRFFIDINCGIY